MEIKTTKELMDAFFESHKNDNMRYSRSQADRKEVYEFEKKIGKQLVDMDVEELLDMIRTFKMEGNENARGMTFQNSYYHIRYIFRSIFDFYIDNVCVIKNPFHDPRMKGSNADKYLAENREALTWEYVESIIDRMRMDSKGDDENRADYIECILLLYYNGFYCAEEIVNLEAKDINMLNKTVRLNGCTHKISDRCFELLIKVHNMTELWAHRGTYVMASWNNKYFKYPVRPKDEYEFDSRTETDLAVIINSQISKFINKPYRVSLNYRNLYHLGFFNFIVDKVGIERASQLSASNTANRIQNNADVEELRGYAIEYGARFENITRLKRSLKPYVDVKYL